jgi:plasmid stability protein
VASITIRNLDADLKQRLRVRAAENGRSMEEEVRSILRSALDAHGVPARGLASWVREQVGRYGADLDIPARDRRDDVDLDNDA